MVFWGKLPTSPRASPRAPRETGKPALRLPAADQDSGCGWDALFYSFFKSLVGKDVVVELKNDLSICGTLHSVDQYLNIKLTDISVTDPEKYPHMLSVKNCFIRGSVVRYVQLPADEVDTQLLQDAARKEALQQKQ
ncbi:U6 snRNA-associated Sm-like protein LSm2 isoform X2 [Peromyscus leucopus]|uniref:U6 snRNA-associated Sm-like protein LSm2 isoform X2 n=1 Tax=Peromyscus leucopus TaxID=10041 RepID=UPI0010A1F6B1|nr:U6 snRNA-associated Sm-like protein LSm2 isoform X2 [Peromyscus leucopus]